ncbi:MAG: hypothetical protein FJ096_01080 [Deltaproteobacteria bacterium]|nr:hypothetical protein [Deltaproteobacteria bacterium]
MKFSVRNAVTVIAAIVVLGGLVRLSIDKRRVAVSLPDVLDGRGEPGR